MAQLTVRNVPEDVAAALKARARHAGRSAEAEHRRILEQALRLDLEMLRLDQDGVRSAQTADIWERLRAHRVTLPLGSPSTTDMIREGRDRNDYHREDGGRDDL